VAFLPLDGGLLVGAFTTLFFVKDVNVALLVSTATYFSNINSVNLDIFWNPSVYKFS
jgi:hypothetical protein